MLVRNCLQDPEVIELIRKVTHATRAIVASDEDGNKVHLLQESDGRFVSPSDSGIYLAKAPTEAAKSNKTLGSLAEQLVKICSEPGVPSVQIRVPSYFVEKSGYSILEPFLSSGFGASIDRWEKTVDLSKPPDEILSGFVKGHRQAVNNGNKRGLRFSIFCNEWVDDRTMQSFYDAMASTRHRSGSEITHPPSSFYEDRRNLIGQGKAALAVARDGEATGFLLALVSRELSLYFDGASVGRSASANHYLQYQVMLRLKEMSSERYSLGYVYPNALSANAKYAGIAYFKNGFGGNLSPIYELTITSAGAAPIGTTLGRAMEIPGRLKAWVRARLS